MVLRFPFPVGYLPVFSTRTAGPVYLGFNIVYEDVCRLLCMLLRQHSSGPGHAQLWIVLWSVCREDPSSMSVPNFKQTALFVQKLGVPKFRNRVMWSRQCPLRGRFIFRTQEWSVLHHCTKFEADSSFRSKDYSRYASCSFLTMRVKNCLNCSTETKDSTKIKVANFYEDTLFT